MSFLSSIGDKLLIEHFSLFQLLGKATARTLASVNVSSPVASNDKVSTIVMPQRGLHTSLVRRDIDSAAKFIGAGAATIGVAGSGAGLASTGGLRIALAGSSTSTPTLTGTVPVRVVEKWMPLGSDVVSEGVFLSKWAILPCSIVGSGNQLSKTVVVILMVLVGMQASYS